MKLKLTYLFGSIVLFAMSYLLCSFYFLSLNPAIWSEDGRGAFVTSIIILTYAGVAFYSIKKN